MRAVLNTSRGKVRNIYISRTKENFHVDVLPRDRNAIKTFADYIYKTTSTTEKVGWRLRWHGRPGQTQLRRLFYCTHELASHLSKLWMPADARRESISQSEKTDKLQIGGHNILHKRESIALGYCNCWQCIFVASWMYFTMWYVYVDSIGDMKSFIVVQWFGSELYIFGMERSESSLKIPLLGFTYVQYGMYSIYKLGKWN